MNSKNKKPLTLPTILKLKARGNGYREIGSMYGRSTQAVQQMTKKQLPDLEHRCAQCLRVLEKGSGE